MYVRTDRHFYRFIRSSQEMT